MSGSLPPSLTPPRVALLLTPPNPCSYLPDHIASTLFADPNQPMHPQLYQYLQERGFRRSGNLVYRPYCLTCNDCIPVRIPVNAYRASRNQKRLLTKNKNLEHIDRPSGVHPDHFELYQKYIASRHAGGPMDKPDESSFKTFLHCTWMNTRFHEFRLNDQLMLVIVLDMMPNSLSAVYSFFDPESSEKNSLGSFAILWAIQEAQRLEKKYLYLGYWIPNCRKMAYKARFKPLEAYRGRRWREVNPLDMISLLDQ
ncbi:MAG: arginyltransferase [Magnetococcus sp. DMHC-6]